MIEKKFELIENKEAIAPYFEIKDNVLRLSFLNSNLDEVELTFSDENGYYYTKNLGKDFSITEGFNLSKLFDGEYAVVLKSGSKTYNYNFEK